MGPHISKLFHLFFFFVWEMPHPLGRSQPSCSAVWQVTFVLLALQKRPRPASQQQRHPTRPWPLKCRSCRSALLSWRSSRKRPRGKSPISRGFCKRIRSAWFPCSWKSKRSLRRYLEEWLCLLVSCELLQEQQLLCVFTQQ